MSHVRERLKEIVPFDPDGARCRLDALKATRVKPAEPRKSASELQQDWRKKNPKKWAAQKARYYAPITGPRVGAVWSANEEAAVLSPDRPCDRELSKIIGRSVKAIQLRRSSLRAASEPVPTFDEVMRDYLERDRMGIL